MDRLCDYVQWMADFPISATGLRDADALVFCALSYIDLSPVFTAVTDRPAVRDCLRMVEEGRVRVMVSGDDKGYPELLRLAAESRRFGDLRLCEYRDVSRKDPPLQFSAVCFCDEKDFGFLAFRGTDSSLAGWKENFMISFTRTEAQEIALRYAEEQLGGGRKWYMGGHSKGGNLALYAACLIDDEKWASVEHLYLLDSPGLCPEVFDLSLLARVAPRTTRVVPAFCVVGKLFAPEIPDTRIIRSSAGGFFQHMLNTWGIDHGGLALADGFVPESLLVSETINEWITDISQNDRVVFVKELFDVMAAGGAESLDQILAGGWEGLEAIVRRFSESSEITKQTLSNLQKFSFKVRLENFLKKLRDTGDNTVNS